MNELSKTIHPMTTKEILKQSFQIYRSDLLKFIGIIILVKGPYLILEVFLIELMKSTNSGPSYSPAINLISTKLLLETPFIAPVLTAAMTMAISGRCLGREMGITEAYSRLLRILLPLLGTILISGILISAGFMLIVPGMFLYTWFVFIPQTVVFDGEGGISAIKRSKHLVKGFFSKTFILLILILMATLLIIAATHDIITRLLPDALGIGAANVVSVILEPFKVIAMMLLYYDLRVRKEGFDLEIMEEELDADVDDDYSAI